MATIYDYSAAAIDGKTVPLSNYRGQVLLIVNTASECGFTPQYAGLETLEKKFGARGFRAWLSLQPVRLAGARRREGDREVLLPDLRDHLPNVRQDRCQRR